MENSELVFSVIVPVYNVDKYVAQCVESILNQSFSNFELIIINDGSTDNSLAIIDSFTDTRMRIITKENGGLSSARNRGILESKGKYILHVDGDDFIDKNTLSQYYSVIQEYPNVDVIVSNLIIYDGKNNLWKDSNIHPNQLIDSNVYLQGYYLVGNGCYSLCNKLWRGELYRKNNILHNESISLGEDSNAGVKLLLNSKTLVKIDFSSYYYRMNPNSMTNNKIKNIQDYYTSFLDIQHYSNSLNSDVIKDYELIFKTMTYYRHILFLSPKELETIFNNNSQYTTAKNMMISDSNNLWKLKLPTKYRLLLFLYSVNAKMAGILLNIKYVTTQYLR